MMRAVALGSVIIAAAATCALAGAAGTVLLLAVAGRRRAAPAALDPSDSAGDYGAVPLEFTIGRVGASIN